MEQEVPLNHGASDCSRGLRLWALGFRLSALALDERCLYQAPRSLLPLSGEWIFGGDAEVALVCIEVLG